MMGINVGSNIIMNMVVDDEVSNIFNVSFCRLAFENIKLGQNELYFEISENRPQS